jgi:hypothetical protein
MCHRGTYLPAGVKTPLDPPRNAGTLPPIRPISWISLVMFVAGVVVGVIYLANGRPKHAITFMALAVVGAAGLWMTSGPRSRSHQ